MKCTRCTTELERKSDFCRRCWVYQGQLRATSGPAVKKAIVAFIRRENEDGTPCSADREVLASRIEKEEHWR